MRANWITSSISGLLMGVVLSAGVQSGYAFALFAISAPVFVIGIPQIRDAFAEMRKRGDFILFQKGDLASFYFPAWGRSLAWFASGAIAGTLVKALPFLSA